MTAGKVSKRESAILDTHKSILVDARAALEKAIAEYNAKLDELGQSVADALSEYNEALGEVASFASGVADEATDFASEKSQTWNDGEKGEAMREFAEGWQSLADALEPLEIEFPEPLEVSFPEDEADFENLSFDYAAELG